MKKILIIFIFGFSVFPLFGKIVENFENYSTALIETYNIKNVSLVNYFFDDYGMSLAIDRNIGTYQQCSNAAEWSEISEVKINLQTIQNWQDYKYLVFYFRDLANLTAQGAKTLQLGIYDGDEYYFHDVNFSDGNWHQIVLYLQDMGLGSPFIDKCSGETSYNNDTKGFTLPLWEKNDKTYTGNGILNLNSISMLKLSFGSDKPIVGEFIIDNIAVVNEIAQSSPFFYKDYTTYVPSLNKINLKFSTSMSAQSITTNSIQLFQDSLLTGYSLNYSSASNTAELLFTAVPDSLYTIKLNKDIKFDSNVSIMTDIFYHFKVSSDIKLGKTQGLYYDNALGIGVAIASNSLDSDESVSVSVEVDTSYDNQNSINAAVISIFPAVKLKNKALCFYHYDSDNDNLKVYRSENNTLTEVVSTIDRVNKMIRFETDRFGKFYIQKINENVKILNTYISVSEIENKIFRPQDNGAVKISFNIRDGVSKMRYKIFDASGILYYEYQGDIKQQISWDGMDMQGRPVERGVYICEITVYNNRDNVEEFFAWGENKGESQTIKVPVFVYK